jgi:hypothetical protein
VGGAARDEQLIANQGQECMGIRTTSKKSWFSKEVKRGIGKYERERESKWREGSKGRG